MHLRTLLYCKIQRLHCLCNIDAFICLFNDLRVNPRSREQWRRNSGGFLKRGTALHISLFLCANFFLSFLARPLQTVLGATNR